MRFYYKFPQQERFMRALLKKLANLGRWFEKSKISRNFLWNIYQDEKRLETKFHKYYSANLASAKSLSTYEI